MNKGDLISRSALRQEILDKMPQGSVRGVFLAFVDDQPTAMTQTRLWKSWKKNLLWLQQVKSFMTIHKKVIL